MASDVTTLPVHGEVFLDARGGDRTLRVSWHHETGGGDGVVVLSLWRSGLCVGSFRMRPSEVPVLIDALQRGLGSARWPEPDPKTLSEPPPQTGGYATPPQRSYRSNAGGSGS